MRSPPSGRPPAGGYRLRPAGRRRRGGGLGFFQLVHQGAALFLELVRREVQFRHLVTGLRLAFAQRLDMLLGAAGTVGPGLPLLRDCHQAAAALLVFAVQSLISGARFRQKAAPGGDLGLAVTQPRIDIGDIGRVFQSDARIFLLALRFLDLGTQAAFGLFDDRAPADEVARGPFGLGERLAGLRQGTNGAALHIAGGSQTLFLGGHGRGGGRQLLLRLDHAVFRLNLLVFQFGKAVLLRQTQGGGTRRFRTGHMAIPAEDGAIAGDQALPRQQVRHQRARLGGGCDNADLGEATLQRRRRRDMRQQRGDALGQGRIGGAVAIDKPKGRRSLIHGRIQVIAKGRTQGRLKTAIDGDVIGNGRIGAGSGCRRQHPGDGPGFGVQGVQPVAGGIQRLTRHGLGPAGRSERVLNGDNGRLAFAQRLFSRLDDLTLFLGIGQHADLLGNYFSSGQPLPPDAPGAGDARPDRGSCAPADCDRRRLPPALP